MDGIHVTISSPSSPESHRHIDQELPFEPPEREAPHALQDSEKIIAYALPLAPESESRSTQDRENSHLLRSFDMIFQLHQRSEELAYPPGKNRPDSPEVPLRRATSGRTHSHPGAGIRSRCCQNTSPRRPSHCLTSEKSQSTRSRYDSPRFPCLRKFRGYRSLCPRRP